MLGAVLESEVVLSVSDELMEEWTRHKSRPFERWLKQMFSRRRVKPQPLRSIDEVRNRLLSLAPREEREALAKDAHLPAGGIEHQGRVLSLDRAMRDKLARIAAAEQWPQLGQVHWADPTVDDHGELCAWLKVDAPEEATRQLRSWTPRGRPPRGRK